MEPVLEPFFLEWKEKKPGASRSLSRAQAFADAIGVNLAAPDVLVVVGSKGKGTAAVYAAATVHAAGESVGLITSPGYRSNRERIRLNGRSITPDAFAQLSGQVTDALQRVGPDHSGIEYLSPTGAFAIAGIKWLTDQGCTLLVVEAGMGGRSDETSLTCPLVVAVTEIFDEHLGILGSNVLEIAEDKAGMICPRTQEAFSLPQSEDVTEVLRRTAKRNGTEFKVVVDSGESRSDFDGLPTELIRRNARLGVEAGTALLRVRGLRPGDGSVLSNALAAVRLPGRTSVHHRGNQKWIVDSSINAQGIVTALDWCTDHFGEPSIILLSIPDSKSLSACLEVLPAQRVRLVRPDRDHLPFSASPEGFRKPERFESLDYDELGDVVLALGTISFIGEVLELLDVDMDCVF